MKNKVTEIVEHLKEIKFEGRKGLYRSNRYKKLTTEQQAKFDLALEKMITLRNSLEK